MQTVPGTKFVPWRFRKNAGLFDPQPIIGQHGWLSIHLIRTPKPGRLKTMWKLSAPILQAPSTFMPEPITITLQAVNRAGTW